MTGDPLYWGLVALGVAANFVLSIREARQASGVKIGPRAFVRDKPFAALLGVIGGVAAGFWMAPAAPAPKWGIVAGLAGTTFLERLSKKRP